MGDGDELDRLSEVFAEFMTPGDDGAPLLDRRDLGSALAEVGIPRELAASLGTRMDPEGTGHITFEDFVNVAMDAAHPAESPVATEFKGHFVFELLANRKKQRITAGSLARAGEKLRFDTSREDLEKMVKLASTEKEFAALWSRLHM